MDRVSQDSIIGIDVSRDWLDIHCQPEGQIERFPNTDVGHERLAELACITGAVVCFEGCEDQKLIRGINFPSGGGQECRLWAVLDAAGIEARQLPPAQKLRLLRSLTSKRGQIVETRKRLLAQIKARQKQGPSKARVERAVRRNGYDAPPPS